MSGAGISKQAELEKVKKERVEGGHGRYQNQVSLIISHIKNDSEKQAVLQFLFSGVSNPQAACGPPEVFVLPTSKSNLI